ncbi:MAG: Xaa-Pro peptidase family protein [Fusobacteria bacterium]|nr:Xaa-Pro peptidase family protein [Fusobacteriota bacterium]
MNLGEKIKIILETAKVDAIWVTNCFNVRYLTGFSGSFGHLLISTKGNYFFTDSRYLLVAKEIVSSDIEVVKVNKNFTQEICELINGLDIETVGVEAYDLSHIRFEELEGAISKKITSLDNIILKIREIKSSLEVDKMQKAAEIADQAFQKTLEYLQVGMSEREVAAFLEYQMKLLGSEKASFDSIVASGYRSSMPHAGASDKLIGRGELITFDFGATYQGYVSDMTRTIFIGKEIPKEMESMYSAVLKAQELALSSIKSGMAFSNLDAIARNSLTESGYGDCFVHGLGHALGIEVHEPPYVNANSKAIIEIGMTFTVEPGAYIDNQFGVRIEDDVYITENGVKILTKTSKKLLLLDK